MVIAWDGSFQNVRLCACVAIKLSHFNGPFSKGQLAAISLKLSINDQAGGIPMALSSGAVSKGTHSREPLPPVGWQDPEEAPSSLSSLRECRPFNGARPVSPASAHERGTLQVLPRSRDCSMLQKERGRNGRHACSHSPQGKWCVSHKRWD